MEHDGQHKNPNINHRDHVCTIVQYIWISRFRELKDPLFDDAWIEEVTAFIKVTPSLLTRQYLSYFRKINSYHWKDKEGRMN